MSKRVEEDKILFSRWAKAGSPQALDKLIRMYKDDIYAFVLYLSGCDVNNSYEVTAGIFLDVLRDPGTPTAEPVSVRLFQTAIDRCRSAKPNFFFNPLDMTNATPSKRGTLRIVKQVFDSFSFENRAIMLLRDQAGLTYDEIAAIMQIGPREIKTMTAALKNRFREKIEEKISR